VLVLVLPDLTAAALTWPVEGPLYAALSAHLNLPALLFGILAPDFLLTCVVVLIERRTRYLAAFLAFPVLRLIDAYLAMRTLIPGMVRRSDGRWTSPVRREVTEPATGRIEVVPAERLDRRASAGELPAADDVPAVEAATGHEPRQANPVTS
jgi:poly-beta-1,6-N-acetyl-D-glucosamine synthase